MPSTSFVFSSRRRHTRLVSDWSSDVCSSDLVYRLRLSTGELAKEISNPGLAGWLVDRDLVVRGAEKPREDGGITYVRREADNWIDVLEVEPDDYVINVTHPIGFTDEGKLLLVSAQGSDTGRVVSLDIDNG